MTESFIKGSQGDLFVQDDYTQPFSHLTCVGVGDLPKNRGDLTPVYCPDSANKGDFVISDLIRGAPALNTTTITRPLSYVANWILEQECAFNALVTYACRGARAVAQNFQVAVLLFNVEITNSTIVASSVAQSPDEEQRIPTNADLAYTDRVLIYNLDITVQTLNNTAAANGIAFLPQQCVSDCGSARDLCAYGFMAMDGVLYNAEIKYTDDGGSSWTETAADPFNEGGNAGDVVVFDTYDGYRVIVARSSSIATSPAEVSWSEDGGATWHNVDVGSVNGQTINDLFKYAGRVWAACSGGYIYVSMTEASMWTALESGTTTTEDLNAICMYSETVGYAVGDNNTFLYTTDGEDWNARTGPAVAADLISVAVNWVGYVFVGATDGNVYISTDEGENWSTLVSDLGAGSVDWIGFDETNRYIGVLLHNTAAGLGTVWRSIDGGVTWIQPQPAFQATTWNSGLNAAFICDANHIFVVGEVHGGTTFVAVLTPD